MKKNITNLIWACLLSLTLLACGLSGAVQAPPGSPEAIHGSGKVVQETRAVSGFHAVNLATVGELVIDIGSEETLRIEAEDNLLPLFNATVQDGTLTIDTTHGVPFTPTKPVKFFLTVKELDRIEASSLGDITGPQIEAESFSAVLSSSGSIRLSALKVDSANLSLISLGSMKLGRLEADRLQAEISGSGSLEIESGFVKDLDARLTSLGSLLAKNMHTPEGVWGSALLLELENSGKAELGVQNVNSAQIRLESIGGVNIQGLSADRLDVWVSGSGGLTIGSGQVGGQVITLTSLGGYTAPALDCDWAEVTITGSGSADIRVSKRLKAELSSLGSLHYTGSPVVEQVVSGSGTLRNSDP